MLTGAVVVLSSCGGGQDRDAEDGSGLGSASCAAVVTWNGQEYDGQLLRRLPHSGRRLGEAVVPGCPDTSDNEDDPVRPVTVFAVPGFEPEHVIIDEDGWVYSRFAGKVPAAFQELDEEWVCDLETPARVTVASNTVHPGRERPTTVIAHAGRGLPFDDYQSLELNVHVTEDTRIRASDLREVRRGGDLVYRMGCNGAKYVALSIAVLR